MPTGTSIPMRGITKSTSYCETSGNRSPRGFTVFMPRPREYLPPAPERPALLLQILSQGRHHSVLRIDPRDQRDAALDSCDQDDQSQNNPLPLLTRRTTSAKQLRCPAFPLHALSAGRHLV